MSGPPFIGFIGAGQMAQALAGGFVTAGLAPAANVCAFDPAAATLERFTAQLSGARKMTSNAEVVRTASVIFLAVKPQHVASACAEVRTAVSPDKLFVSIAAGVPLATLAAALGSERLIRVMPNTPCLVARGASAYSVAKGATLADADIVSKLLGSVGIALPVDEKLLDVVTGLSGSGPAYAFLMIEALADGAVAQGLPRAAALQLAAQTLLGAATMVLTQNEHPSVLRDRVASPGGTTMAGLAELERLGLRGALIAAVAAATRRSQELGK